LALQVECASLNQELQDMEVRARRGQKKSPEEANQMIQVPSQGCTSHFLTHFFEVYFMHCMVGILVMKFCFG
jgi:hypothetical protein